MQHDGEPVRQGRCVRHPQGAGPASRRQVRHCTVAGDIAGTGLTSGAYLHSKLETWPQLLHFLQSQSRAAAQNTAVSLGSYHTAVLLNTHAGHTLYTFGRGALTACTYKAGQPGKLWSVLRDCCEQASMARSATAALRTTTSQRTASPTWTARCAVHALPEIDPGLAIPCLIPANQEPPAVVSCGGSHNALITTRGKLFTWGLASSGELGHGGRTPSEVRLPRQV